MPSKPGPRRIDQLARTIRDRAALCASGTYGPDEAVKLAKDLSDVLESGDYVLQFRVLSHSDAPVSMSRPPELPPTWRPIAEAKWNGKCHVCGDPTKMGHPIYYSPELRKVRHPECGEKG